LGEGVNVLIGEKMQWASAGYKELENKVNFYVWTRNFYDPNSSVTITYTDDSWATVKQTTAGIVETASINGFILWSVIMPVDELTAASNIQFAAEYQADGQTFWDNNYGKNYSIDSSNNVSRK